MREETKEEVEEINNLFKVGKKFIVRENGNFYAVLTERAREQFKRFFERNSKDKKQID